MGAPPPQGPEHEEGPAEAAPEEEGKAAADAGPEGGYANQHRRRTQVIELDGYYRVRSELLHNFNMGLGYVTGQSPRVRVATRLSRRRSSAAPAREVARRRTWATPQHAPAS